MKGGKKTKAVGKRKTKGGEREQAQRKTVKRKGQN